MLKQVELQLENLQDNLERMLGTSTNTSIAQQLLDVVMQTALSVAAENALPSPGNRVKRSFDKRMLFNKLSKVVTSRNKTSDKICRRSWVEN